MQKQANEQNYENKQTKKEETTGILKLFLLIHDETLFVICIWLKVGFVKDLLFSFFEKG